MVIIKKKAGEESKGEQEWDNPQNPEKATDSRDFEQLKRQAEEAERRKENLTEEDEDKKEQND